MWDFYLQFIASFSNESFCRLRACFDISRIYLDHVRGHSRVERFREGEIKESEK